MTTKEKMLLENKAWVLEKLSLDKDYFQQVSRLRSPNILWIESTDSHIPVREVTNTEPGEVLVYSNIANQIRKDDPSLMAVLEEAIEIARVQYIVVCGYSHCAGIRDVLLGANDRPLVKAWLSEVQGLYEKHYGELRALDLEEKEKRLSELNIALQVSHLSQLAPVQKAWEKSDFPVIYGWYFDLKTGLLKEVFAMEENHRLKQIAALSNSS